MFQYEYKQKVQFWSFRTLALPWNLCAETQYCTIHESGTGLAVHVLSLFTPHYGVYAGWDFRGLENTRWIFRARTDNLIHPSWCPNRVEEICVGDFLVPSLSSLSPGNAKWYPFCFSPWLDQASTCWDNCPWPSLSSPGSVNAMVTHVQTLHPDVSSSVSLTFITVTIFTPAFPTMRFGKALLPQTMASC